MPLKKFGCVPVQVRIDYFINWNFHSLRELFLTRKSVFSPALHSLCSLLSVHNLTHIKLRQSLPTQIITCPFFMFIDTYGCGCAQIGFSSFIFIYTSVYVSFAPFTKQWCSSVGGTLVKWTQCCFGSRNVASATSEGILESTSTWE